METQIKNPNYRTFKLAKQIISNGENVAFPTETVYGLGADAFNDEAVEKIFLKKGRAQDNPLIVHFARKNDIKKVAVIKNELEKKLIAKCMPGPISIVFEKKKGVCKTATCNGDTVAVRIPSNKVARKFILATKTAICAPSANTSKRPSPTTASEVYEDMNTKIPLIINGGKCDIGVESTVVRVVEGKIHILRPGKFSAEDLHRITKAEIITNVVFDKNSKIVSPGTKYAHYCPSIEMIMIKNNIVDNVKRLYAENLTQNKNPIILCSEQHEKEYENLNHIVLGKNSDEACKNLFTLLRKVEKSYDIILGEFVFGGNMEDALFNRMSKSCSGKII